MPDDLPVTPTEDEAIWSQLQSDEAGTPDPDPEPDPEPAPEPEPVDEPAAAASDEPEPNDAPAPDPWEGASEAQLAARDALSKERDAAAQKERRMALSVPGQTRKINELIEENRKLKAAQAVNPDPDAPAEDSPELIQAREDYPEVVGPLEAATDKLRQELIDVRAEVSSRFTEMDDREKATYKEDQTALLAERHPDFLDVATSTEFGEWVATQPPMVQHTVSASANADELSLVLSLYAQSRAAPIPSPDPDDPVKAPNEPAADPKRKAQLASADTPKSSSRPQITPGLPEDEQAIWDHYKEQDKREARAARS